MLVSSGAKDVCIAAQVGSADPSFRVLCTYRFLGGHGASERAEHNYDTLEANQVKDGDGKAARCEYPHPNNISQTPSILIPYASHHFE